MSRNASNKTTNELFYQINDNLELTKSGEKTKRKRITTDNLLLDDTSITDYFNAVKRISSSSTTENTAKLNNKGRTTQLCLRSPIQTRRKKISNIITTTTNNNNNNSNVISKKKKCDPPLKKKLKIETKEDDKSIIKKTIGNDLSSEKDYNTGSTVSRIDKRNIVRDIESKIRDIKNHLNGSYEVESKKHNNNNSWIGRLKQDNRLPELTKSKKSLDFVIRKTAAKVKNSNADIINFNIDTATAGSTVKYDYNAIDDDSCDNGRLLEKVKNISGEKNELTEKNSIINDRESSSPDSLPSSLDLVENSQTPESELIRAKFDFNTYVPIDECSWKENSSTPKTDLKNSSNEQGNSQRSLFNDKSNTISTSYSDTKRFEKEANTQLSGTNVVNFSHVLGEHASQLESQFWNDRNVDCSYGNNKMYKNSESVESINVDFSKINDKQLLYSPLKHNEDNVDNIIPFLSVNATWEKQLSDYFQRLSIDTIGQLAKMSLLAANFIPVGDNRILRLKRALEKYDKMNKTDSNKSYSGGSESLKSNETPCRCPDVNVKSNPILVTEVNDNSHEINGILSHATSGNMEIFFSNYIVNDSSVEYSDTDNIVTVIERERTNRNTVIGKLNVDNETNDNSALNDDDDDVSFSNFSRIRRSIIEIQHKEINEDKSNIACSYNSANNSNNNNTDTNNSSNNNNNINSTIKGENRLKAENNASVIDKLSTFENEQRMKEMKKQLIEAICKSILSQSMIDNIIEDEGKCSKIFEETASRIAIVTDKFGIDLDTLFSYYRLKQV